MQTTTQGLDLPQPELWLPTGQASRLLGCSPDTLKRYIKRDGFLIEGEHWYQGPIPRAPTSGTSTPAGTPSSGRGAWSSGARHGIQRGRPLPLDSGSSPKS